MQKTTQTSTLIETVAEFLRSETGKTQMRLALEQVSGEVEIQPPLTLEKLMSVFGTTVLLFQPDVTTDSPLRVGRITTTEQREKWISALGNLDKLLNNQPLKLYLEGLTKKTEEKKKAGQTIEIDQEFLLGEMQPIEQFVEELALRSNLLIMEATNRHNANNFETTLPNFLKIGELLTAQLETLSVILDINEKINPSPVVTEMPNNSTLENQRASSIATETLLKREFLTVSSSASYQAMREVVALKKFAKDVESPYPTAYVDKATIKGKIQLTPLKPDTVRGEKLKELEVSMWRKREQLSDLHVDVIDAMCATWIIQAASPDSKAVITADDILKLRGLKPHLGGSGRRGGFTAEQRTEIIDAIQDLENLWFEITEKVQRGKKSKTDFIQSRALAVLDRGGQINLDGTLDVTWFVFRPGSIFARYLLTEGRQTALLSARALRYHVRAEAVEKRLVRYLSWQWRIRSKTTTYLQPYDVQTLVKECGLQVPKRNVHRVTERLEKALDKLQSDNLISGWQYIGWEWEQTKKHGWVNDWLSAKIAIEPPDFIKDSYETIHSLPVEKQTEIPKLNGAHSSPRTEAEIAKEFKNKRKSLKLTQMQLSEELELSQATLARVEGGKKVSDEAKKKVLEWLKKPAVKIEPATE
jgi:DNA-binding transcriptional regulator YiaG